MHTRRVLRTVLPILAGVAAPCGDAAAACGAAADNGSTGTRIAAVACTEHALWYAPFIDEQGRLAHVQVSEAESLRLSDGVTPAWRRVADYWQGSGLSWSPAGLSSGTDCLTNAADRVVAALCRAFLVDTPWSAAFVSFVMSRAGVPGFRPSARHVDYVRDARRNGEAGPYRLADPDAEAPSVGDLLCFVRVPGQVFGHAGFLQWLDRPFSGAIAMHCDIVVSTEAGRARAVGGNVLQGVTMRSFALNRAGRLWSLPRRTGSEPECTPASASACNFNRQDWVALLKLDAATSATPAVPPDPSRCCEVCTLPMPAGVHRCASAGRPEEAADPPP